jgi:hypothetical protein
MKLLRRILAVLGLVTATTALQVINPAIVEAAPSGDFSIVTKNGNRLDVYGDNLPTSKAPVHLWKASYRSNIFTLGPNESTGNEIRLKADQSICLTPDVPLGTKPASGTPLVAKKDCANSYNFKFDGNKIYLGRYPDMCIDIPNNNDVERQRLQVHACNNDSTAQSFNTGNNPIPQPVQKQAVQQKQIVKEYSEYEYWLLSDRRTEYTSNIQMGGHTYIALIKRDIKEYNNGNKEYSPWKAWKTFGNWGNNHPTIPNGLRYNYEYEMGTVNDILNSQLNDVFSIRKAKVSEGRANWIANNPGYTGCKPNKYNLNLQIADKDECTCVVFATRHWTYFTANWENYQPYGVLGRSPKDVADKIDAKNKSTKTQFLDDGKIWE